METNTMEKTYSKAVQELRKKNYVLRPIYRKGGWVPQGHDSAFLNDGAKIGIVVPARPGNILVNPLVTIDMTGKIIPFTKEDIGMLADELGLPDVKDLNFNTKKNYWRGNTVMVDRNGLYLFLDNVADFVKYLILRSDSERIAPSWLQRFDRGTYKFALVEKGEELDDNVNKLEDKKNAYIMFGKMDTSVDKMKDFLFVYYLAKRDAKIPPKSATLKQLKDEIGRIIEDDLRTYLNILEDDNYILKLLIQKSVQVGALKRDRHVYSFPGADHAIGTIEDLIDYLENPKNQDARMKLMHQVDVVEKGSTEK